MLGSEVLCIIDSPSIRYSLSVSESPSTVCEPFKEENLVQFTENVPPRSNPYFCRQSLKPSIILKSLSLPMSVSIMVIEVQWACSILCQILGLDNEKYMVEVMLGFLLTFFQSESNQSVSISFDKLIVIMYTNN
jgi:hypothetical protein